MIGKCRKVKEKSTKTQTKYVVNESRQNQENIWKQLQRKRSQNNVKRDERYLWKSTTAKKLSSLSTGTKTLNRFQEEKIVGKTKLC